MDDTGRILLALEEDVGLKLTGRNHVLEDVVIGRDIIYRLLRETAAATVYAFLETQTVEVAETFAPKFYTALEPDLVKHLLF